MRMRPTLKLKITRNSGSYVGKTKRRLITLNGNCEPNRFIFITCMVQNIGRTGPQPNIEIGSPDRNAHSIDILCHRFDSCSSLQLANVAVVMHSFSSVRVSVCLSVCVCVCVCPVRAQISESLA